MKSTTSKRFSGFLKNLAAITLMGVISVGCGQSNKSGGNSSSNNGTTPPITTHPNTGINGSTLPSNYIGVIRNENPCQEGGQRTSTQFPLQGISVNAGAVYVGVSSYGDIAVVSNTASGPMMQLEICMRAGATGQGQMLANPVINNSDYCPVGEITAADITLQGQIPMQVKFAPIHVPGTYRTSSLCNGMYR
jgi:hypothetical protein